METTTNATAAEFRAAREASGPPDILLSRVLRGYRADPLRRWSDIREGAAAGRPADGGRRPPVRLRGARVLD